MTSKLSKVNRHYINAKQREGKGTYLNGLPSDEVVGSR